MRNHSSLRALAVGAAFVLTACGSTEEDLAFIESQLVVCAKGATVQGIDVSHWQGNIDWAKVHAAGKEFGIAELAVGTSKDATFAGHWSAMKAQGMIRGAYQYFLPNTDPIAQADVAIAAVGGKLGNGDLPVMLDVEATGTVPSPSVYNQRIHQWADRVQAATGKKPMIYTGKYYWPKINTGDFASYPLVHPQYTTASCPNISDFWSTWLMWQYRGDPTGGIPGGTCPGISGYVDLDVFNGSLAELRAFAGVNTCTAHCEAAVAVGADCSRTDCAATNSTCTSTATTAKCTYPSCPATGTADVCLDDTKLGHCVNGTVTPNGDCATFAAYCSSINAPTGARCVSAFCVSSPNETPTVSDGCWFESPPRLTHCNADGVLTLSPCPAGQQCTVVGGAHCAAGQCPDAGSIDYCSSDTLLAHCLGGSTVTAIDCGMRDSYCSTAGGAPAHCTSTACVGSPNDVPVPHNRCLETGLLAHCDETGAIGTAAPCPEGSACVDTDGGASCVTFDAGTPESDGGMILAPDPVIGGCGCSSGGDLSALFGVAAMLLARRRSPRAP